MINTFKQKIFLSSQSFVYQCVAIAQSIIKTIVNKSNSQVNLSTLGCKVPKNVKGKMIKEMSYISLNKQLEIL